MDPYRTLGVPRGCTREAVKAAFRAKVASTHPDSGGEELAFIKLRAAYEEVLAELDRRAKFDANKPPNADITPKPTDPDQRFGLVLLEGREPPEPVDFRKAYISLIDRISATAKPRPGKLVRSLGPIVLLYIVLMFPIAFLMGGVAIVVGVNDFDPNGPGATILGAVLFILDQVCALGSACFLVLKYDLSA